VLVGPDEGELAKASGGVGRNERARRDLRPRRGRARSRHELEGKRCSSAPAARERPLDAVRFLGNRSSGWMGVALAEEARLRGAEVTLVAANLSVPPPGKVELVPAPTAAELEREVLARSDADVVLMAAAGRRTTGPQSRAPASGRRTSSRGR